MPRRTKAAYDRRSKRLWFRVTPAEAEALAIQASAVGQTVSDYVRGAALGEATRPVARGAMACGVPQLVRALTQIGIRLNAIAEAMPSSASNDCSLIAEAIQLIRDLLNGLR